MFFAVILVDSRKLLTIPAAWCYKIDIVKNFKEGLRQWRDKVIFYSPDFSVDPNFRLEIQSEFEKGKNACYMANILGSFYCAEDSDAYLTRRRTNLPPNYSEGRIPIVDLTPEIVAHVDDPLLHVKQEINVDHDIQPEFGRHSIEYIDLTAE